MPEPTRLLILRHGETDGNLHRIMQTPDTPLNELGLRQAATAARRIVQDFGSKLIIRSSDYTRARQTAEALSRQAGMEVSEDPILRERSLGNLRGRAYADLDFDPFAPDYHPPGGESWEQFFERTAAAWQQVPSHVEALPQGHNLVLVTHGLVCRALAQNHFTPNNVSFPNGRPQDPLLDHWPNTSLTALERVQGQSTWNAVVFNCGKHLDQLADPDQPETGPGLA